MKNKNLRKQLLNLKPKGVSIIVPFFKEIICDAKATEYTPVDGYQAAVISMSLNPYIEVTIIDEDESKEVSPSDINFLDSFNLILIDQEPVIEKAFSEFKKFIDMYLKDESEREVVGNQVFRDLKVYEEY
jgi:hypothetical protein